MYLYKQGPVFAPLNACPEGTGLQPKNAPMTFFTLQNTAFNFHPAILILAVSTKVVPARHKTPDMTLTPTQPEEDVMMRPAIGPVTNPPIDARKYTHPVRIPISESGEIWTISAAIKEIYAPEKKPKGTVNAIIAPSEFAGIQMARVMILEM